MKLHALLTILFAVSVKAKDDDSVFGLTDPNPAICTVNPHYSTFDGLNFDWQGLCRYNLTTYCAGDPNNPLFRVVAANEIRDKPAVSWPLYVEITYAGDKISLLKSDVLVNGVVRKMPYNARSNSYSVVYSRGYKVFTAKTDQLQVAFDNGYSIIVQVGSIFANKVCGLCGNFDGVSVNDWTKGQGGSTATNGAELGDSWVTGDEKPPCQSRDTSFPGPPASQPISTDAANTCAILSDPKGVLGTCVTLTSDDDKKLNQDNCKLDAGYSDGESAKYSLRHFAIRCNYVYNNIVDVSKALAGFNF